MVDECRSVSALALVLTFLSVVRPTDVIVALLTHPNILIYSLTKEDGRLRERNESFFFFLLSYNSFA